MNEKDASVKSCKIKNYDYDRVREGFKKTKINMDLSIFGWVGDSGWGKNPYKKQKKNMPLKSILDHSKSF